MVAGELRKRNARERRQQVLDTLRVTGGRQETLAQGTSTFEQASTLSLADVRVARQRYREFEMSAAMRRARFLADAWCAAFVQRKQRGRPMFTQGDLNRWTAHMDWTEEDRLRDEVEHLAAQYRFFHWHLEFPQIFQESTRIPEGSVTGWAGGFSCVLGNPPWERIKLQEQEFFAARDSAIALAPNAAARKRMIAALAQDHPALFESFQDAKREAECESHLVRNSGRYPLCGRGDINTYTVFAENDRTLLADDGSLGVIVPTGIATDATTQYFFRDLVETKALVSLYDFENRKPLFDAVDSRTKFCLLTLSGRDSRVDTADFAFFMHDTTDLAREGARFRLTPEEIMLLNPNTGTCPVFRSRRDAEITLGIYRRVPVLIREGDPDGNPWGVSFMRMFDMSNDSGLFHTRGELEAEGWVLEGNVFVRGEETMLPLYEAKMVNFYDHRAADVVISPTAGVRQRQPRYLSADDHDDPDRVALPHSWVAERDVRTRLSDRNRQWLLGFADVTSSTNERTMIVATFPRAAVGHTLPLLITQHSASWALPTVLSSFAFDYLARTKLGGTHATYFVLEQLPILSPSALDDAALWAGNIKFGSWILPRLLELTHTAWHMAPFAQDLGDDGPPFRWDEERRAVLRAELDAAFFHLYGLGRDDTNYILGTFPIVNRKDVQRFGEERTRRLVLENYDAMTQAMRSGEPFQTRLDPAPGCGPRHVGRTPEGA